MLFNSYIFIFLFLPLVLAGYYGLNHFKQYKLGMAWLIGMSMWFYGYNSIHYLFILIISILLNYLLVEGMSRVKRHKSRQLLMIVGILLNLGILFYYKYYDFFIENVNAVLEDRYSSASCSSATGNQFLYISAAVICNRLL